MTKEQLLQDYGITIKWSDEGYVCQCVELDGCVSVHKDMSTSYEMCMEMIEDTIDYFMENNIKPIEPISRRT